MVLDNFDRILEIICQQSGPQPLRFWIVRHGQSLGNADGSAHAIYGDPGLPLTELGVLQAKITGQFLKETFDNEIRAYCAGDPALMETYKKEVMVPALIAHSPYMRARHTAHEIHEALDIPLAHKEILSLSEQSFGVWDGKEEHEYAEIDPHAHEAWNILRNAGLKFYAANAQGQSPFDVTKAQRNDVLPSIFREIHDHDYQDIIVVCHGATARALIVALMNGNEQTWNSMVNPPNGGVHLVEQTFPENMDFAQGESTKFEWAHRGLIFDPNTQIAAEAKPPSTAAGFPKTFFGATTLSL